MTQKLKALFKRIFRRREPIEQTLWRFRASPARVMLILDVVMAGGYCYVLDGWAWLEHHGQMLGIHPSGKGVQVYDNGERSTFLYSVKEFREVLDLSFIVIYRKDEGDNHGN